MLALSYSVGANSKCEFGRFDNEGRTRGHNRTVISLSSSSAVTLLKQLMGSPPLQTTPRKLLISDPLTIQTSKDDSSGFVSRAHRNQNFVPDCHSFWKRTQINWNEQHVLQSQKITKISGAHSRSLHFEGKLCLDLKCTEKINCEPIFLIAHVCKNGLMKFFMDFWRSEPLKNSSEMHPDAEEELGSGGELRKSRELQNKKSLPLVPGDCKLGSHSKCTPANLTAIRQYTRENTPGAQCKRTLCRILVILQSIRDQLAASLSPSLFFHHPGSNSPPLLEGPPDLGLKLKTN